MDMVSKAGFVKGYRRFQPNKSSIRVEAVVMVQRILNEMEQGLENYDLRVDMMREAGNTYGLQWSDFCSNLWNPIEQNFKMFDGFGPCQWTTVIKWEFPAILPQA